MTDFTHSYSRGREPQPPAISHTASLLRLKAMGWQPGCVYDIGAFHGDWTKAAARVFPRAEYVLFEANGDRENELKRLGRRYAMAALSARDHAEAVFYLGKDVHPSGASLYRENTPYFADSKLEVRSTRTRTLDSLVAEQGFPLPDLAKIDTQGAELDVIAGGRETLSRCAVLILETSVLNYNKGAPMFAEVVAALAALQFRCVDICEVHRCGPDLVFQLDLLFVNDALYRKFYAAAGLL